MGVYDNIPPSPDMMDGDSSDPTSQLLMLAALRKLKKGSVGGAFGLGEPNSDAGQSGLDGSTLALATGGGTQPQQQDSSLLSGPPDQVADTVSDIHPAGFDSMGIPSEYPATARMHTAADRLQKMEQPPSFKQSLVRAGLLTLPTIAASIFGGGDGATGAAAQGTAAGEETAYGRMQHERDVAKGEYQFEAGQEEHQREAAIRERLAMGQLQAQTAYRKLLIGMQGRRADISQQKADLGALNTGWKVDVADNGSKSFVPLSPSAMNTFQTAKLGLEKAQTDYDNAKTKAIPEQLENTRKALNIALDRFALAQQGMDLQQRNFGIDRYGIDPATNAAPPGQPMIDGQVVGTKNKMPTTIEDRSQQAQTIDMSSKGLIDNIRTHADVLGPWMGRYGSLTDALGNPPKGFAEIASQIITYIALQPAAHGFKGLRAVQEFEKSIGTPIRTPEALIEGIMGNVEGLAPMASRAGRYQGATPADIRTATAPPARDATSKLKKGRGDSSGGNPPRGATVRDYTQLQ